MAQDIPAPHYPTDKEHKMFLKDKEYMEIYAGMKSNIYGSVSYQRAVSDEYEKRCRSAAYDAMNGVVR